MATTWNSSDKSIGIVLSNGDLTATASGDGFVRATTPIPPGIPTYWEINIHSLLTAYYTEVGIGTILAEYYTGSDAYGWAYDSYGAKNHDGGNPPYGDSYTDGDVIGIAVNANKIWFAKNNVWQGGGDPAAGTGEAYSDVTGTIFPMISIEIGKSVTGVFDSGSFSPPSGFSYLDTEAPEEPISQEIFGIANNTIGFLSVSEIAKNTIASAVDGIAQNTLSESAWLYGIINNGFGSSDSTRSIQNAIGSGSSGMAKNTIGFFMETFVLLLSLGTQITQLTKNSFARTLLGKSENEISFGKTLEGMILNEISDRGPGTDVSFMASNSISSGVILSVAMNEISFGKTLEGMILNEISGSPSMITGMASNEISDIDRMSITGMMSNEISDYNDPRPAWRSVEWKILFDGIDITDKIDDGLSFTESESSPHNQFSASSMNRDLFFAMDPEEKKDQARIEIRVGTRSVLFCFEKKSGDQVSFQIWGRSKSALDDDVPKSTTRLLRSSLPISAMEMAASVLETNNLEWKIDDWVLPANYEFEGTPLGCVLNIAETARSVVRCADDGTIIVRRKWPVRPVYMGTVEPDVSYNMENILSDSYSTEHGTGFDAIRVQGWSPVITLPELEVEESSPVIGTTVHIRVWPGHVERSGKPTIIETFVTAGVLIFEGPMSEEKNEIVTFNSGSSSVAKPISNITSFEWIGYDAGQVSFDIGGKELRLSEEKHGLAHIGYVTEYDRYRLQQHNIEMILAVWSMWGPDVSVTIRMNGGQNMAPSISDEMLTGVAIAVDAGTAELDDTRYDTVIIPAEVPYYDEARDGATASFDHIDVNAIGNFKIESVITTFSGPQVKQTLKVKQCRLSTTS